MGTERRLKVLTTSCTSGSLDKGKPCSSLAYIERLDIKSLSWTGQSSSGMDSSLKVILLSCVGF